MTQHSTLTAERWSRFDLDRQVLMIGNEMHRAMSLMDPAHRESLGMAYERVLRLVDLTVEVQTGRPLRRELLRWRDLVAELFVTPAPEEVRHREVFRGLLLLRPAAARQIPYLLG